MKTRAGDIIKRIHGGERVTTSTVHVSETANILEQLYPLPRARQIVSDLIQSPNVEVLAVDRLHYEATLTASERHDIGLNDALACVLMRERGIETIYSFDRYFDGLPGIRRVTG